jgi:hypothetical protein
LSVACSAWIRSLLNTRNLEDAIEYAVVMSGENINKFYHPFALVCNEEDLQLLITILRSIRVISFSFVVDDRRLNDVPMWVALGIIPETGSNEGRRKSLNVSVWFVI